MIKKQAKFIANQTGLSSQEAWWLLEHITKKSHAELFTITQLSTQESIDLDDAIFQIKHHHKPLAYILGFVPFLNLKIQVESPILIPRHETEEWVANIIERFKHVKSEIKQICDMGTGSGCIALAMATNFPDAHVTAADINPQALVLAQKNATLNGLKNITFVQSDLFANLNKNIKFDLIVSNPPYIDPECAKSIKKQVTAWEDHQALFAKDSGLCIISQLIENCTKFLQQNKSLSAQLIFEIDQDQHEAVLKMATKHGLNGQAHKDSFGQWRTIWCTKK
jgi:release factor glutamine methyltransferase